MHLLITKILSINQGIFQIDSPSVKSFCLDKTKQPLIKSRQNNLHSVHTRPCRIYEQSGPNNKQQSTTHGNAPKGSGSYLRPKTHIQHTHPQHLSTIYVWKILENLVPKLVKPLQFYVSDRRGRLCSVSHVRLGHTGTLAYSSFRWKGIRLFNSLPMHIRNITACPPLVFKKQLDLHLSPILDCPCTPNFNNSLDNKY